LKRGLGISEVRPARIAFPGSPAANFEPQIETFANDFVGFSFVE